MCVDTTLKPINCPSNVKARPCQSNVAFTPGGDVSATCSPYYPAGSTVSNSTTGGGSSTGGGAVAGGPSVPLPPVNGASSIQNKMAFVALAAFAFVFA